jgi:2-isopropylmalate synthase
VRAVAAIVKDSTVCSLARANDRDIKRAAEAIEPAKQGRIHTFIATSPIHMEKKLRMTPDQVFTEAVNAVRFARKFTDDIEFSPEDAGRSEFDFLCRVLEAVIREGAKTVNIPDTVGYTMPDQFGSLIARLRERIPNSDKAVWSVHCHNDLGLAVANSLAAVMNGARQVECTINGIGERAGNCSLEEIVMAIKTRRDRLPYETGIQTELLYPCSQLLTSIIGVGVQPNKAIVGRNAFAHEAGIHQDGFLKERTTYEIIDPKSVGVPESRLVLGKHSGRHALKARCEELGLSLDRDELDVLYGKFSVLADRKKGILDDEIRELVGACRKLASASSSQ